MNRFYFLYLYLIFNSSIQAADFSDRYIGPTHLSNTQKSDISITGPANFNDLELDNATITGPVRFNKLIVKKAFDVIGAVNGIDGKFNQFTVTGQLTLLNSEINKLKVIGHTNLKNVKININVDATGFFEAYNSVFADLVIISNEIKLYNTTTNNILVKKSDAKHHPLEEQVLELVGTTIIHGNIIFESKRGKVLLSKSSKINGRVEGGEIYKF